MSRFRKLVFAVFIFVMLAVSPARALAEGGGGGHSFSSDYYGYGVVLGPISYDRDNVTGAHKVGYVVYARNRYDAACYVLGMQPSDVSSITSEQRAKLSNESTGGDYWSFAQRAYQFGSGGIPSWVPVGTNLSSLFTQSDDGKVWALDGFVGAPFDTEYQDAKQDMQAILDGEDIGGGGSGGEPVGDNLTFSGNVHYSYNSSNFFIYSDSTNTSSTKYYQMAYWRPSSNPWPQEFTPISNPFSFSIPKEVASSFIENHPFTSYDYFASLGLSTNGNLSRLYVYAFGKGNYTLNNRQNTYVDALSYISSISTNGNVVQYLDISLGSGYTYTYSGTSMTLSIPNATAIVRSDVSDVNGSSVGVILLPLSTSSSEPTLPPTNWPDEEPTEPTEPTVPGPGNTTITGPTYINKPTYVSNTYTADFQGLLDALDEHCQHLQDSMYENFKASFERMSDYLGDEFDSLKHYLHDLFEWLADEMEHTISGGGYSDSTVVSWLKKIWSKIGSGVSTKPVDPVSDTDGIWDWLMSLFGGFLASLAEKGLQLSGALHGLLDDLVDKFPFSVPWDILALLALFTADPVTPAIDFDMHLLGDMVVSVDIDLSDYDSLMATVRPVELIAFAAWLLWLTPEVLRSLNVSIGGGD